MNILYIEHYAGSITMGMEFRPYYLAREWIRNGHNVRIVAADYSHLRVKNPVMQKDFSIESIDDVTYQWVHTRTYQGNGMQRALTMFQFCTKLWLNASKLIEEFHPDVVIASSTYPLDAWPAVKIAKKAGIRYIHEAHDLWPLTLTELGGMSKANPFVIMLQLAENYAYSHANCVVSLFPNALGHMMKHGMKEKNKYVYIPNGIVADDWSSDSQTAPEEISNAFEKAHEQGKSVICYLGGHAMSNALGEFITAAGFMSDEMIEFFLVGKGVEKEQLQKSAAGIKNVHFFDAVPKGKVPTVLQKADFLYVGATKCPLYRFGVSLNKVYDYMMAGKPILYGVEAANNEVEAANCGVSIVPGSVQSIVDGVRQLLNMNEREKERLGQNGKKWVVENRSYDRLAKKFEGVMTE